MASLKEIKGRITSVKSTQKITSAMKMVSSAKLRKAQGRIENFLPYEEHLHSILTNFLSAETDFTSPLAVERDIHAVSLVVLSSNSSLCGAFNSNILRLFRQNYEKYQNLCDTIYVYSIGKKAYDVLTRENIEIAGSFPDIMDKPDFEKVKLLADELINQFLKHQTDKVELIFTHFKSTSSQLPIWETFLPIELYKFENVGNKVLPDYIVEPDKEAVLQALIPKSLRAKLYAAVLDSAAAEQAARMIAMQIATENANEILHELTIQYNKQRQQAITSELLDILGGSEALK